jgi:hypothetical protein
MEDNIVAYGHFSGQRLGKHVPVARQQILNNATVGRNNRTVFYVVRAEML